jgi:hypothetical protein
MSDGATQLTPSAAVEILERVSRIRGALG